MKAIVIDEQGGPEVMQLKEIPVPKPGKGEVLIHVEYSGCAMFEFILHTSLY